jgi:hypothetical protein
LGGQDESGQRGQGHGRKGRLLDEVVSLKRPFLAVYANDCVMV